MSAESTNERFSILGLAVMIVGFSFVLTFNGFASALLFGVPASGQPTYSTEVACRVAQMASFIAMALWSKRLSPLSAKSFFVVIAAFLCFAGSLAAALFPQGTCFGSVDVIMIGAALISGAMSSFLYLAWIELVCHLNIVSALVCFAAAYTFSGGTTFACTALIPDPANTVLISLFPLFSIPLYLLTTQHSGATTFYEGESTKTGWSFPLKPVILMVAITFANSAIKNIGPEEARGIASLGSIVFAGAILAFSLVERERFDPRRLFQIAYPLIVAAALCTMMPLERLSPWGPFLSSAAFVCFIIFISVTLCGMSFRYGINPLWLFGFVFAARIAARSLVIGLEQTMEPWLASADGSMMFMGVIIISLAVLYPFSVAGRGVESSWGMHLSQLDELVKQGNDPLEELRMTCMVASRKFGLTHREEEILLYLAQGLTLPHIGKLLCVSTATVKTHTQHVYRKLNVHSKQELIELLDL